MNRSEIAEWVEEQKRITPYNETIEISKKDLLRVIETLNDPLNALKSERRNLCYSLMFEIAETASLKKCGLYELVEESRRTI